MKYSEAQERLRAAFMELAIAKQEFVLLGGELNFEVRRGSLHLDIVDGPKASFPITVDEQALKTFREANPQNEYKP